MSELRIGEGIPANHAARAINIHTLWPPVPTGETARHKAAAVAGARGESAKPLTVKQRRENYFAQRPGANWPTPRQGRRITKKARAAVGREAGR